MEAKRVIITLRLSARERRAIHEAARAAGVSVQAFIMARVFGTERALVNEAALGEVKVSARAKGRAA